MSLDQAPGQAGYHPACNVSFREPASIKNIRERLSWQCFAHSDKPAEAEGFPMRSWSVEIYLVHATTNEDMQASLFSKAVYNLHPSFNEPIQSMSPGLESQADIY